MPFVNSIPQNLQSDEYTQGLISDIHAEYDYWRPVWRKLRDVVAGEDVVKDRGTDYLPKLEGQDDAAYRRYLLRAAFMPVTSRTLEGLLGSIFQRPPKINNLPAQINTRSVSYDGQSLSQFLKNFTREILHMSRGGILVDIPPDGGDPYFAAYQAEQIRNWSFIRQNGRLVPSQIVLYEITEEPKTLFGTSYYHQYRILALDENGEYFQTIRPADQAGIPVQGSEPVIIYPQRRGKKLNFIPFICINRADLSLRCSKPALLDIANMNISHYLSYADLEQGRHMTALPTYYIAGEAGAQEVDEGKTQFVVGAENIWLLNQDDKAGIIEFHGHGLTFLENAVTMKEQQMALLGARIIGQPRRVAAEASDTTQLRNKGEQSILLDITDTINEGLSIALRLLVWWYDRLSIPDSDLLKISIELNQDFSDGETTPRELRVMQQLYEGGILPLEVLFNVFKASGVVPTYMTIDEFKLMLAQDEQRSDRYDLMLEELRAKISRLEAQATRDRAEASAAKKAAETTPQRPQTTLAARVPPAR